MIQKESLFVQMITYIIDIENWVSAVTGCADCLATTFENQSNSIVLIL